MAAKFLIRKDLHISVAEVDDMACGKVRGWLLPS
jgi:hypothetical protein